MTICIERRQFISALGVAAAWPLAARAQQPALPVVGYLELYSEGIAPTQVEAFRNGLRETGYVEGRNVVIEFRWADGQYDRYPAMAADLVRLRAAVIFATGPLGVRALTLPVVCSTLPVGQM